MKRKFDNTINVNVNYAVVETIENDSPYVQFLPHEWLVPVASSSKKLVVRGDVKFYFPLRLKNQTKDSYCKFVKHAKFIGMKPENDGKWEIRDGRILMMGLGTLEEAINAQKMYSDYFSTTEAEMQILAPESKRCVRKKKKVASSKEMVGSDSEDDIRDVNTIPNFNTRFATPSQETCTLDQQNITLPVNVLDFNQMFHETMSALQDDGSTPIQQITSSVSPLDGLSDPSNEIFVTLNLPVINGIENEVYGSVNEIESLDDEIESLGDEIEMTTDDVSDQKIDCGQNSCCKGHQKIMNKIDYVHKKFSKQFSLVHQENAANRKLLLRLLALTNRSTEVTEDNQDNQFEGSGDDTSEDIHSKPTRLDVVELDEFHAKYKATFPIQSSDVMIEFNKSMKLDQKFVDNIFAKLSQIEAEDETKVARKILKELCDFRCLKDFTWQGTKKMKSFEGLHLVVKLVTGILQEKFPDSNAMETLTKVVKQRTKSAKEAWTNFLEKNVDQSSTPESGQAAPATVSNHSTTITSPETNVPLAANSVGEKISTTSEEANGSDLNGQITG